MGRKPNAPLSNKVTNSSPNILNWENAKHGSLDQKNLMYPPLPPEVKLDLQCWSESEVNVKRKPPQNLPEPTNAEIQRETGTSSSPTKARVRTRFSLDR